MKLLEGKTTIITGAARGIGKAIAQSFAQCGSNVIITDVKINEETQEFINQLNDLGIKAKAYASDASSFQDCQKLLDEIEKDFPIIDILINNAGITKDNLLMRMSEDEWDMVMNINLKSVFNMTKAVQKFMLKQRKGSIINMSSVVGISGNPGQSNYSASKSGMIGFTKSIAKELGGRNIRCNAVAPGFIETDMTAGLPEDIRKNWLNTIPLKRGGTTDDVANLCLFLASDMSTYITGQVITVCGGLQI
jgi:3-oxoacyl-[acyl-carrier protein] reductase